MIPITLNSKSWHYHLATEYGHMYGEATDLCTYTKHVLKGATHVLLIVAMFGSIAGSFGDLLSWAVVCIHNGVLFMPRVYAAVAFACTVLGTMGVILWAVHNAVGSYQQHVFQQRLLKGQLPITEEPSFFKEAYKSFKEKTCVRITFDDPS